MTLTFFPICKTKIKADTRALAEARRRIHRELRQEIEEEVISRALVDRHNSHLRRSREFRDTGSLG